jgi:hypothetical protein
MTVIPRRFASMSCLLLCLAACAAGGGGSGGSGGSGAQLAPAASSHPLAPAPTVAADPVPATAAPSILAPARRDRRPLVRPAQDPGTPPLRATGSEIPEAPYALPDAPRKQCADPRPVACNLDYKPVCAEVDTGVRCITTPCPSSERKTYSSACKACRDPKAGSYVPGRCPPADPIPSATGVTR